VRCLPFPSRCPTDARAGRMPAVLKAAEGHLRQDAEGGGRLDGDLGGKSGDCISWRRSLCSRVSRGLRTGPIDTGKGVGSEGLGAVGQRPSVARIGYDVREDRFDRPIDFRFACVSLLSDSCRSRVLPRRDEFSRSSAGGRSPDVRKCR